ncbi:MAG: hypothetical protein ACPG4N_11165, partial [Gammaproteobacteria bacterium]
MRLLLILALLVVAGWYWFQPPSAVGIARGMVVNEGISHEGRSYQSEWAAEVSEIRGIVRRKDRHYDEHIPIITYDMPIATGEFAD